MQSVKVDPESAARTGPRDLKRVTRALEVYFLTGRPLTEHFADTEPPLAQAIELPEPFDRAHDWHRTINLAEMARSYARYYDRDPMLLSDRLRGMIEEIAGEPRIRLRRGGQRRHRLRRSGDR